MAGAGVSALLRPRCDAECLDELGDPDIEGELSFSIELAWLGNEAACEACVEHAGDARADARYPELQAWRRLDAALGLLESDRVVDAGERRLFV